MRHINLLIILAFAIATLTLGGCKSSQCVYPAAPSIAVNNSNNVAISGSTTAMATYKNAIYAIDMNALTIINTTTQEVIRSNFYFENPETLYVYQHYLYIAGGSGVDVYDIEDPLTPVEISTYPHARGCDPIIINDNIGYITLRNRPQCNGDINQLEIVDFSDPAFPAKISDFPMQAPYGLAKAPDFLAVCEEEYGLRLLDVSQPQNIQEISQFPQFNCFDLIYHNNTFIMTATDGIYQLDAHDAFLTELSRIPIEQ